MQFAHLTPAIIDGPPASTITITEERSAYAKVIAAATAALAVMDGLQRVLELYLEVEAEEAASATQEVLK